MSKYAEKKARQRAEENESRYEEISPFQEHIDSLLNRANTIQQVVRKHGMQEVADVILALIRHIVNLRVETGIEPERYNHLREFLPIEQGHRDPTVESKITKSKDANRCTTVWR